MLSAVHQSGSLPYITLTDSWPCQINTFYCRRQRWLLSCICPHSSFSQWEMFTVRYNFEFFHFKISSYRCFWLYGKVWLFYFLVDSHYKIGTVFLLEKITTDLVEHVCKGKMSGEEWKRYRIENQDVWNLILNLFLVLRWWGSCHSFAPMRVGTCCLVIYEPRFPRLYNGGVGTKSEMPNIHHAHYYSGLLCL